MKIEDILTTRNWVGKSTPRKEDARHLRGEATFIDDLDMNATRRRSWGALTRMPGSRVSM